MKFEQPSLLEQMHGRIWLFGFDPLLSQHLQGGWPSGMLPNGFVVLFITANFWFMGESALPGRMKAATLAHPASPAGLSTKVM